MKNLEKDPQMGRESQRVKAYIYNRFVLKMSKRQAALRAGYSPNVAKCPLANIEKGMYYNYLKNMAFQRDDLNWEQQKIIEQNKNLDVKLKAIRMAKEEIGDLKEEAQEIPSLKLIIEEKEEKEK